MIDCKGEAAGGDVQMMSGFGGAAVAGARCSNAQMPCMGEGVGFCYKLCLNLCFNRCLKSNSVGVLLTCLPPLGALRTVSHWLWVI